MFAGISASGRSRQIDPQVVPRALLIRLFVTSTLLHAPMRKSVCRTTLSWRRRFPPLVPIAVNQRDQRAPLTAPSNRLRSKTRFNECIGGAWIVAPPEKRLLRNSTVAGATSFQMSVDRKRNPSITTSVLPAQIQNGPPTRFDSQSAGNPARSNA